METPPPACSVEAGGIGIDRQALTRRLGVRKGAYDPAAGRKGYEKFLRTLTVTEKPQRGRPKHYARKKAKAWRFGAKEWGEPRRRVYVPRAKAAGVSKILPPAPRAFAPTRVVPARRWVPAQPFWPNQLAVAAHVTRPGGPFDVGADPLASGAFYLEMGTGLGKTRTAAAVAARVGGPVLVAVPTKHLRDQCIAEFGAVFPLLAIGSYANPPKGSRRRPAGPHSHDIVVGIVNTIRKKPPEFFAPYALVIFDECHEYGSASNIMALWASEAAPRRLGLSASPLLSPSGLDRVVFHMLGAPVDANTIPGFDAAATNFMGRVREVHFAGHPDHCVDAFTEATGSVSAIGTIANIVGDPYRAAFVAAEALRLFRLHETAGPRELAALGLGPRPASAATPKHPAGGVRRHHIFVFAELRDYLDVLREKLIEVFTAALGAEGAARVIYAPECEDAGGGGGAAETPAGPVVLRGGATAEDRELSHQTYIVLTTYGYSRRGISILPMSAMIKATSRRSGGKQIDGRITRRGADESIVRYVVDIVDTRTRLKGQVVERRKGYRERGWVIAKVKAKWEDFAAFVDDGGPLPELPSENLRAPGAPPAAAAEESDSDDERYAVPTTESEVFGESADGGKNE